MGVLALLAIPVVLAYSNIFAGEFTLDDSLLIVNNPTIRTLWPPGIFQHYISHDQYLDQLIHVRLVPNFLFALNYALGGLEPWGYHAVNLAIHLCNTLLVFGVVRRTLLTPPLIETFGRASLALAVAVALLWGLHPVQTAAVTYTAQRMEALMALFYLLTLYAWIRGAEAGSRPWLALAVGACFLGMMSKEVMVTAPAMVLLYDGMFLAGSWRQALRQRWPWYAGLALSAVWLVILVEHVPGAHGAFISAATAPNDRGIHGDRWSYAATMPGVILYYLRLLAWPDPLVFDYKWPVAATRQAVALPGAVLAIGWVAAIWGFFRRQPWAFPIAWYLIILLPSSSFLPLYNDYIFEYRLYLPSLGPLALAVLLVGWGLQKLRRPGWRWAGMSAGVMVFLLLAGATYARNDDYGTELALWSDTVQKAPQNERAHLGLGDALFKSRKYDEAAQQYRAAILLNPAYSGAHFNLGAILEGNGQLDEALDEFRAALETGPDDINAHNNMAAIFLHQGRLSEALGEYRAALRLNPAYANMHVTVGQILLRQGHADEAVREFRQALRLDAGNAEAQNGLALALRGPH